MSGGNFIFGIILHMKKSVKILLAAGAVSAGVVVAGCRCADTCNASSCSKETVQCAKSCVNKCVVDSWAFDGMGGACWIGIKKDVSGAYSASVLWVHSSPVPQKNVKVDNGIASMDTVRKDSVRSTTLKVNEDGKTATVTVIDKDAKGNIKGNAKVFTASRIPAMPPAPELSKIVYGEKINLLAGGIDGWEPMNKTAYNGWTIKDGVLSNRIKRTKDGKPTWGCANLRTKRSDFFDFNLKYDVRVLPGCNSGVYLRGIYEIQVIDSCGKPVDCHNMAAFYGRITPSVAAEKPANEWQSVDVTLYKRHVTVVLNGRKIIDNKPVEGITGGAITSNEFIPGPIYLQGDHSDADFRNMILTPIVK